MLTRASLLTIMPRADYEKWIGPLNGAMAKHFVTTPLRVAAFVASVAEESVELTRVVENLMYTSPEQLRAAFPTHFDALDADDAWGYVKQPERIANRVYASRMGNGPEASGDGWRYRGRGLLQLTGRTNYRAYGHEKDPESLAAPDLAADSAGWYWSGEGLNALADAGDFKGVTKHINGGYNGWTQRKAYYERALALLK